MFDIKNMKIKYLQSFNKKIKFNYELQKQLDSTSVDEANTLLEEYNRNSMNQYLASGISSYFNNQIDDKGLSCLSLEKQDTEDAKFISSCFGQEINYGGNDLSILYTTLLGTTELNYARQTFPAGIYEDVFNCSQTHEFPIQIKVGESEIDYYCRVIEERIMGYEKFQFEKKEELMFRTRRLTSNFCNGKNRIYLIPIENVMNNKASFGDMEGLRDGNFVGSEMQATISNLHTLSQLLDLYHIDICNIYNDPNMTSEYGIAIYGEILNKGVTYIEVDRGFDLIQKRAVSRGYSVGDYISKELYYNDDLGFSR